MDKFFIKCRERERERDGDGGEREKPMLRTTTNTLGSRRQMGIVKRPQESQPQPNTYVE